jgi:hypothetical protein
MWIVEIIYSNGKTGFTKPYTHYAVAESAAKRIAQKEEVLRTYLRRRTLPAKQPVNN